MKVRVTRGGKALAKVSDENGPASTVIDPRPFVDPTKCMTLEEMVATITPENRHELIDFGPPMGKVT